MREGLTVKRTIGWMLLALLVGAVGFGATAQNPITALEIEPGVAQLGAGGAGLSIASGAETLYYNPAGLAALPGISFSSFYASHFGLATYSAFALTFRNFGVAVLLLSSGNIQGYDADGAQTETLGYGSTGFVFGAGLTPGDLPFLPDLSFDFALGARIKVVTAKIGEERGTGFGADLGFRTTLPDMRVGSVAISDIALAIAATNLFGAMSYDTVQESFVMDLRLGGSALFLDVVTAALDVHLGGGGLRFGLSYSPASTFTLRLGALSMGGLSITAGLGVNVEGFLIDYAFVTHTLGMSHRVSLTLDFSSLDISALSRSLRRLLP
jgi:hypothetical protein